MLSIEEYLPKWRASATSAWQTADMLASNRTWCATRGVNTRCKPTPARCFAGPGLTILALKGDPMPKLPKTALHKGQQVSWATPQGETSGRVEAKLTRPITIKRFRVQASPEQPKILVSSDRTGKQAAHAEHSLRPIRPKAAAKRRIAR